MGTPASKSQGARTTQFQPMAWGGSGFRLKTPTSSSAVFAALREAPSRVRVTVRVRVGTPMDSSSPGLHCWQSQVSSSPQTRPWEQPPHDRVPPQPSGMVSPHSAPRDSQVSGTQQVPHRQGSPSQSPHSTPQTGSGPHSVSEQSAISGQPAGQAFSSGVGVGSGSPEPKPPSAHATSKANNRTHQRAIGALPQAVLPARRQPEGSSPGSRG